MKAYPNPRMNQAPTPPSPGIHPWVQGKLNSFQTGNQAAMGQHGNPVMGAGAPPSVAGLVGLHGPPANLC